MRSILTLLFFFSLLHASSQNHCLLDTDIALDNQNGLDNPELILEQSDGKLLAMGTTNFSSSNSFEVFIARLNLDHSIDASFGDNGKASYTWEERNNLNCAFISDNDDILIGGHQATGNGGSAIRSYVARLSLDGEIDTDFGVFGSFKFQEVAGQRSATVGIHEYENGVIQVVAVTDQAKGILIYQLDQEGQLDTNFHSVGYLHHEITDLAYQTDYSEAIFQDDGSLIFVGKYRFENIAYSLVAKIGLDGELTPEFGEQGIYRSDIPIPYVYNDNCGAIDSDGNIYVGITNDESPSRFGMFKLTSDGMLDSSFGESGVVEAIESGNFNAPWDLVLNEESNIIYSIGHGGFGSREGAIWTIDMQGNELSECSSTFTLVYDEIAEQGLYSGLLTSSGELRLLGKTSVLDETGTPSQNMNMSVPIGSSPSSILEFDAMTISCYPNPVKDILHLDGLDYLTVDYQIIAIDGRIMDSGITSATISTQALRTGYYLLLLTDADGMGYQVIFQKD